MNPGGQWERCKLPQWSLGPKLNLVHFSVKYVIWWEQFYLFCKELTDQIQCGLSTKSKKAPQIYICERSEQKKIGPLQNCRILFYAYFGILYKLPSKKSSPWFSIFISPQFFPGGICLHRSMEWAPLHADCKPKSSVIIS